VSLFDLSDSDTVVDVDSDSDTLVAVDAATIEDEDKNASLGEIAGDQVFDATIQTQTPAPSQYASTQASASLQDPATDTELAAGFCLHGLWQLVRRIFAKLRRTSEPRTKKCEEVAQLVHEFGGNFQSYTTRSAQVSTNASCVLTTSTNSFKLSSIRAS